MASTFEDRAAGALMGAFIGDALGVGPHWYYDLDEMHAVFGPWISDYTDPQPGRYHEGLKAGQLSQAGIILEMTVKSLVDSKKYDQADFCRRLDEELFPKIDGNRPMSGPGGYTSQSIRETWRRRVEQKLPWGPQTAGHADTTEAIERTLAIAVRYAMQPSAMADAVARNTELTQSDEVVQSITVAFGALLGQLLQGLPFDANISGKLFELNKAGELPFHSVTRGTDARPPNPDDPDPPRAGRFASPDALGTPATCARAAADPGISIEPAWKAAIIFGKPCAIYHIVPATYYLAARFHDDFESAVLHAVNGGGQNLARALLTGALAGAQVGLSGIPARFLQGLENSEALVALCKQLASQAAATK